VPQRTASVLSVFAIQAGVRQKTVKRNDIDFVVHRILFSRAAQIDEKDQQPFRGDGDTERARRLNLQRFRQVFDYRVGIYDVVFARVYG